MASVAKSAGKGKKKKALREARIVAADEYDGLPADAKAELIRQLVPLGLTTTGDKQPGTQTTGDRPRFETQFNRAYGTARPSSCVA